MVSTACFSKKVKMTVSEKVFDTIVVGGGLVGSAIAWGLAREGEKVALLDEGDIALRASRGNFGLVWVQSKGKNMPEYARWSRRSADLWSGFAEELKEATGISPDYHKPGGLHLLLSEEEREEAKALNKRMSNYYGELSPDTVLMDRKQVEEILPGIGPEVVGASWSPHDGHASPLNLLRALHMANAARGTHYVAEANAREITRDGSGNAVETDKGTFRAAKVILAAGHGNKPLGAQVGLNLPLIPEKGQILVTERTKPFIPMPLHVMRQTEEGTVLLGDSHEDTGYSTESVTSVLTDIARYAVRCLPKLAKLRIVRTWGAVRILTPDGSPIYDQSETHPGVFSVNCHSGVTLAGAHALALAPQLAAGKLDPEFDAFSSRRFDNGTVHIAAH